MLFDVEFLLLPRSKVSRSVLYIYRKNSGVFRRQMIERVSEEARSLGFEVFVSVDETASAYFEDWFGGLAGDIYQIVDVKNAAKVAFADFVEGVGKPRMLLIPEGAVEVDSNALPTDVCLVTEPTVAEDTLQRIVTYLEQSTDLFDCQLLANRPEFRTAMIAYARDAELDLLGLKHSFDEIMLTCIDVETKTFDTQALQWKAKRDRASQTLTGIIRKLLEVTDDWSLKNAVLEIDRRHIGSRAPADKVVKALMKSSARLLVDKKADAAVIYWILLIFIWKGWLLQGSLVSSFYKLCAAYRQAKHQMFRSGAFLDAHWGTISAQLSVSADQVDGADPADGANQADSADQGDGAQLRDLRDRLLAALSAKPPAANEPTWLGDLRLIQSDLDLVCPTTTEKYSSSDTPT